MAQPLSKQVVCQRFGVNLRRERLVAGLSQEELADRACFDRTYISSAERGRRNVSLCAIVQLSTALAIAPSALLADVAEVE